MHHTESCQPTQDLGVGLRLELVIRPKLGAVCLAICYRGNQKEVPLSFIFLSCSSSENGVVASQLISSRLIAEAVGSAI